MAAMMYDHEYPELSTGTSGRLQSGDAALIDSHDYLLDQAARRVADLLKATAEGRWPAVELQALAQYLQTVVLQQVEREEGQLFPRRVAPMAVPRLSRDHARLRAASEVLARSAEGEGSRSLDQIDGTARSLLVQLQRHVAAEEGALSAAGRRLST
jgi:hypothetical protein